MEKSGFCGPNYLAIIDARLFNVDSSDMNTSKRVGHAVGIHTHIIQGAKDIHCL